ncbi:MAG: methyltransferase domain-containing protein [Actinomycetota bacterium]|nr:methyltransferase domain-containing protein [Actinomycetota bacterium]
MGERKDVVTEAATEAYRSTDEAAKPLTVEILSGGRRSPQEEEQARFFQSLAREQLARQAAQQRGRAQTGVERAYPAYDPVGSAVGLSGAGILGYLVGDHLHPPMVPDGQMWADGHLWRDGAKLHSLEVGDLAALRRDERVIDVGCGLGGPARIYVSQYNVDVVGTNLSPNQAASARQLNERAPALRNRILIIDHDCRERFPDPAYDCVISLNMIYHVDDKEAMLRHAREALRPAGRLVIDDWMLTNQGDVEAQDELERHFSSRHFAVPIVLEAMLERCGFEIVEIVDLGYIARRYLSAHFTQQMWTVFAPQIIADFPDELASVTGMSGSRMVRDFCEGVELSIRLYRENRMTYRRILAVAA